MFIVAFLITFEVKRAKMLFAIKNKTFVIILLSAITLFFSYNLKNLSFEHDLASFFNKNNSEYRFSKDFFKQFGEGKNYQESIIIGLKNQSTITHDFMSRVQDFSNDITQKIDSVEVYSILNKKLFIFTSIGKFPYKIFHLNDSTQFNNDLKIAQNYPEILGKHLSKNKTETLLFLDFKKAIEINEMLKVKEQIINLSASYNFERILFFNSKLTRNTVVNKLKKESIILTAISIGLVIIILLFFTRSLHGVLVPLSVVLLCVVWILGSMGLLNVPLNVLSIAIPVIVGVISLSDVIHIVSRYSEDKNEDKFERIRLTQKDMFKAIVLTSITTSLGFLSLIPSQIKVFVEFGFFTTLGVLFAFLLAYFLLPILLFYSSKIEVSNILIKTVPKKLYSKKVMLVLVLFFLVSVLGVFKLKNDSYIYDDINAKDQASKSIKMINQNFYGIRDLSLAITLKDTSQNILAFEAIKKIEHLQNFADSLYGINNCGSLVMLFSQFNRALNGGKLSYFNVPSTKKEFNKLLRFLNKNSALFDINQLLSRDKKSTFIYAKTKDVGSYSIKQKNKKLEQFIKQNLGDTFNVKITGGSHILDQTNFSVTNTMFYSLLGVIFIIFLIITILFKSVKIGLISIIPNIFPLLVILAVIGWFDLGINISTSIVFTIVFGIAVDDTIHFLSRYKVEKQQFNNDVAIINTLKTSGGAISLTTIILVAGFGVLMFSEFSVNFLTGLLVCIGLISALLCDLFALPVFLKVFASNK